MQQYIRRSLDVIGIIQTEEIKVFQSRLRIVFIIMLFGCKQFHVTVIVVIAARTKLPSIVIRKLMVRKMPVPVILTKHKECVSQSLAIVERKENIHISITVEIITRHIRDNQIGNQCLFLELVAAFIDTRIDALPFFVVIDIVGDEISVQIFHRQFAGLPSRHETVVAHVVENCTLTHQIDETVTVHVQRLLEQEI